MIVAHDKPLKTRIYQPLEVDFNFCLVTDRRQTGGRPLMDVVAEALRGGLKALQLREKDLGTKELLRLAYELRELTLRHDARLFINDRIDIAIAVDADGVHLGHNSLPPFAVRKLSSRLIVGVSTHSLAEALLAEKNGADLITLGPIHETPSKKKYGKPLGLEKLKEVSEAVRLPVFAIGGIKFENAPEAIASGASGVAVISAVFGEKNIRAATGKLVRELN